MKYGLNKKNCLRHLMNFVLYLIQKWIHSNLILALKAISNEAINY